MLKLQADAVDVIKLTKKHKTLRNIQKHRAIQHKNNDIIFTINPWILKLTRLFKIHNKIIKWT